MSSCNGRGECLQQCCCTCYEDDECNIPSLNCTCGHREHLILHGGPDAEDQYCQRECPHNCKLMKCRNYKFCGKKYPQQILDCRNGMCAGCAIQMGRHETTEDIQECPVCLENTTMIILEKCNHKICSDCWYQITKRGFDNVDEYGRRREEGDVYKPDCPLCRSDNGW